MGDRPGSSSRVRTSEDKVRRKDKCWSVRAVYILVKLPDVSGPSLGEVGRYRWPHCDCSVDKPGDLVSIGQLPVTTESLSYSVLHL